MSDLVVPPHVMAVMRALTSAAEARVECPSNEALAERIDVSSTSTVARAITLLEVANLIAVERGSNLRVVTIIASGKRTAGSVRPGGNAWSDADDATIMDGMAEGRTYAQIASVLRRSKSACQKRFAILASRMGAQAA